METDFITLTEFREFMFAPIVPVEDLYNLTGKPLEQSFPYWRKHNLLPFIPDTEKLSICFVQLIWIRILDSLSSFGYSLGNIQKACNYFFKDAYDNKLSELNLTYNKRILEKKALAGTLSEEEKGMQEKIDQMLKDELLKYGLQFDINYLSNLITNSIASSEEAGILFFMDGTILEHIGTNYYSHTAGQYNRTAPHIYLSIRYFFEEFIDNEDLATLLLPQSLNANETKVLKEIRNKNINEIVIAKQGTNIIKIEASSSGNITGEQANEIRKILGLSNYGEIKISTRDEKTLTYKRTKKKINSD
jgi:hypothetical protein